WLGFRHGVPSPGWALVPLVAFAILVARHWDATAARQRAERAVVFYRRGLDRLEGTWAGGGETGERFRRLAHPYADDLDLFGDGSLFQLLCTARTRAGEETLAAWLLAPARPEEVRARQEAGVELRGRLDPREQVPLLGADVGTGVHPDALAKWGCAPPVFFAPWLRIVA